MAAAAAARQAVEAAVAEAAASAAAGGCGSGCASGSACSDALGWAYSGVPPLAPRVVAVVDYDDTLLPTSWLSNLGVLLSPHALSAAQRDAVSVVDAAAEALLTALAGACEEVVVITNASAEYAAQTAAAFLPRTAAWLAAEGIMVLSARDRYAAQLPDAVPGWKAAAFLHLMAAWRLTHGGRLPTALLSLGDGDHERDAARALPAAGFPLEIMTLKMLPMPSAAVLTRQLNLLPSHVAALAARGAAADLSVVLD